MPLIVKKTFTSQPNTTDHGYTIILEGEDGRHYLRLDNMTEDEKNSMPEGSRVNVTIQPIPAQS